MMEFVNGKWEGLSHILWKMKNVPNHQPDIYIYVYIYIWIEPLKLLIQGSQISQILYSQGQNVTKNMD